jgi:hypothetical protein
MRSKEKKVEEKNTKISNEKVSFLCNIYPLMEM